MNSILGASATLACLLYLVVAVQYSLILRRIGFAFIPVLLFSAVWSISPQTYPLDLLHTAFISTSFLIIFQQNQQLPRTSSWYVFWLIPALAVCTAAISFDRQPTVMHLYVYLVCCIGTLLIAEQLIKNNGGLIKAVGLGMGALLLYNVFIYASALVGGQVDTDILRARALGNTTIAILLALVPLRVSHEASQRRNIGLSRPLVFTTTSLMLAGGVLLSVTILSYLSRLGGYEYAAILEPFLLFLAILVVGFNLVSTVQRARMRVWINKHFFQAKFDYNNEWRLLSERLSPVSDDIDPARLAVEAILPIYNGNGGVCFVREGNHFHPRASINPDDSVEPISVARNVGFFEKLQSGWIFVPASTDVDVAKYNHLIPNGLDQLSSTLLILPLVTNEQLLGFITVAADPDLADEFDWEDLDLMRMVGKQVSNFVGYEMLSNELVVTRQFEAFNQFTTFIVHDLKNLIAQQALVVQNAARFIDNPEFVADAINTIDNSVKKMNRIIMRLSDKASPNLMQVNGSVSIEDCLRIACDRCKGRQPEPRLHLASGSHQVRADPDNLAMALTHLLVNAQEACSVDDKIDVYLTYGDDLAVCKIVDTGVGMDQDFINQRLFKPFDSTKKNKGMGIGAYQCREILSKMGGYVSVSSNLGEGTCFTISLPLINVS